MVIRIMWNGKFFHIISNCIRGVFPSNTVEANLNSDGGDVYITVSKKNGQILFDKVNDTINHLKQNISGIGCFATSLYEKD